MLVLERAISSHVLYRGQGMVLTGNGPAVTNVAMAPADPKLGLRMALAMARAVSIGKDGISNEISSILKTPIPFWE
jgi:hypothetical protein